MATDSSILAWRIPRTEEPGGLPSMGSHRVGHNWRDLAAAAAPAATFREHQPSPDQRCSGELTVARERTKICADHHVALGTEMWLCD